MIRLSSLRACDIPSPFVPGAAEVLVTSNGHAFHVASGRDHSGRYYTVRCGESLDAPWAGFRTCNSIADVRRLITTHS